eukprot:tig00020951_g16456.t1
MLSSCFFFSSRSFVDRRGNFSVRVDLAPLNGTRLDGPTAWRLVPAANNPTGLVFNVTAHGPAASIDFTRGCSQLRVPVPCPNPATFAGRYAFDLEFRSSPNRITSNSSSAPGDVARGFDCALLNIDAAPLPAGADAAAREAAASNASRACALNPACTACVYDSPLLEAIRDPARGQAFPRWGFCAPKNRTAADPNVACVPPAALQQGLARRRLAALPAFKPASEAQAQLGLHLGAQCPTSYAEDPTLPLRAAEYDLCLQTKGCGVCSMPNGDRFCRPGNAFGPMDFSCGLDEWVAGTPPSKKVGGFRVVHACRTYRRVLACEPRAPDTDGFAAERCEDGSGSGEVVAIPEADLGACRADFMRADVLTGNVRLSGADFDFAENGSARGDVLLGLASGVDEAAFVNALRQRLQEFIDSANASAYEASSALSLPHFELLDSFPFPTPPSPPAGFFAIYEARRHFRSSASSLPGPARPGPARPGPTARPQVRVAGAVAAGAKLDEEVAALERAKAAAAAAAAARGAAAGIGAAEPTPVPAPAPETAAASSSSSSSGRPRRLQQTRTIARTTTRTPSVRAKVLEEADDAADEAEGEAESEPTGPTPREAAAAAGLAPPTLMDLACDACTSVAAKLYTSLNGTLLSRLPAAYCAQLSPFRNADAEAVGAVTKAFFPDSPAAFTPDAKVRFTGLFMTWVFSDPEHGNPRRVAYETCKDVSTIYQNVANPSCERILRWSDSTLAIWWTLSCPSFVSKVTARLDKAAAAAGGESALATVMDLDSLPEALDMLGLECTAAVQTRADATSGTNAGCRLNPRALTPALAERVQAAQARGSEDGAPAAIPERRPEAVNVYVEFDSAKACEESLKANDAVVQASVQEGVQQAAGEGMGELAANQIAVGERRCVPKPAETPSSPSPAPSDSANSSNSATGRRLLQGTANSSSYIAVVPLRVTYDAANVNAPLPDAVRAALVNASISTLAGGKVVSVSPVQRVLRQLVIPGAGGNSSNSSAAAEAAIKDAINLNCTAGDAACLAKQQAGAAAACSGASANADACKAIQEKLLGSACGGRDGRGCGAALGLVCKSSDKAVRALCKSLAVSA